MLKGVADLSVWFMGSVLTMDHTLDKSEAGSQEPRNDMEYTKLTIKRAGRKMRKSAKKTKPA